MPQPPESTLFPYTTLFRSQALLRGHLPARDEAMPGDDPAPKRDDEQCDESQHGPVAGLGGRRVGDRKSTRLNSSHMSISYAVFCLKKKTIMIKSKSSITSS